jgi:adenine phosphoribosyltransferase
MQADAIKPGQTVVVVDDIIATGVSTVSSAPRAKHTDKRTVFSLLEPLHVFAGGSAAAAGELVEKQGGTVLKYLFVAEATYLGGAAKLGAPVYSIAKFDD